MSSKQKRRVNQNQNFAERYSDFFDYLDTHRTIPSLLVFNDKLTNIITRLVDAYTDYLETLDDDPDLEAQRLAIATGFVSRRSADPSHMTESLSPYFPLSLGYRSELKTTAASEAGSQESLKYVPPSSTDRLSPVGLIPYAYVNESEAGYVEPDKSHSGWLNPFAQVKKIITSICPSSFQETLNAFVKHLTDSFPERIPGRYKLPLKKLAATRLR